jgi:uncharacterized protein (DUF736 family)
MSFEGQDWCGKKITITPNTNEMSIEHGPEYVHIRLPDPKTASVIKTTYKLQDDPSNPYKLRWGQQ